MRGGGHIDIAVKALRMAAAYAEDGAVMTALACLDNGRAALEKEAERRRGLGMVMNPVELPKKRSGRE